MKFYFMAGCLLLTTACSNLQERNTNHGTVSQTVLTDTSLAAARNDFTQTNNVTPQEIVDYAETLIGIPYKYASTNPEQGFDCSGFITYVFNHFNIEVPRSSVEFTNAYPEVPVASAKEGDLILFTGTDSTEETVGHMGIIVFHINDSIAFIHSTSGKANGVTITPLNDYYKSRFVKIVSIFGQHDSSK